ncbi:MAG: peptidase S24 [Bacteroides sp.]|nr:peptidase S24 [Bacteroides sp.]
MNQQPSIYLSHERIEEIAVYTLSDFDSGLPPWVDNYMNVSNDLDIKLLENSRSTLYCKVTCDLFKDENIGRGDILVIDTRIMPQHGDLIACLCDGEFMVKKLCLQADLLLLIPSNPEHSLIRVSKKSKFMILGVITYTIIKQRRTS